MNIPQKSLSFKSKIKFVDYQTFENLPLDECNKQGKYIDSPYSAKEIINGKEAYTDTIRSCSAGGITNKQSMTMFHLGNKRDISSSFSEAKKVLEEKSGIKPKDNKEFNALLIGGKYHQRVAGDYSKYASNQELLDTSELLYDELKSFMSYKNIEHSVFWGQPLDKQQSRVYYSCKDGDDSWYINTNKNIDNLEDLKNAYKFIQISEKDRKDGVFINGKQISDKDIQLLNETYKNQWSYN